LIPAPEIPALCEWDFADRFGQPDLDIPSAP